MQDQFYVELRELKKGNRFYVRFINPETNEILSHRSVEGYAAQLGLLKKGDHIRRKKEAERICTIALEKNLVYMAGSDIPFIKYAQDFWAFEGDRIRRRNLRKKGSIGKDYAMIMYANIDRYIKPNLPKDILLKKITSKHVEGVINALLDKGVIANATIQKIQQTLAQPLTHAYKKGLINIDPTKNLEAIDSSSKTARGAFTPSEIVNLISRMSKMENLHAYLAVVLSAATGMRQGEVMALRASNIVPVNEKDSLITIEEAFAKKAGIKDPKGKKVRYAPIAKPIADALIDFASKNTFGNDLVFWSFLSKTKPCSASYIQDGLYEALADMLEDEC